MTPANLDAHRLQLIENSGLGAPRFLRRTAVQERTGCPTEHSLQANGIG